VTGGKSFHAVDVDAMDAALDSIEQQHQKTTDRQFVPRLQQVLYHWPLLAGLFVIMLMTLLPYAGRKKLS